MKFQIEKIEDESLRCQIGISNEIKGGRRYLAYVFTENGVAMLSSVLSSERAVEINISIMRIFTQLKSFHSLGNNHGHEIMDLKNSTNQLFKIVFERLDNLEECLPEHPKDRKKIGLNLKD